MPGRVDDETEASKSATMPAHVGDASFLTVGQVFSGRQRVDQPQKKHDEWRVNVTVQGVDFENGTICGSMEALDVPNADSPVLTFWRGEIIDNRNYFFWTERWNAHRKDDIKHWSDFQAFAPLKIHLQRDRVDEINLAQNRYIFMRWKEIFFVSPGEECGLTIAGFYYVCMDRQEGSIEGYYFDRNHHPIQKLELAAQPSCNGFSFAEYKFS